MAIVAGVDSSTQSCTVLLCDADDGSVLGVGSERHPPTSPPISEQHPADWWSAFANALHAACTQASCLPSQIAALSVAAQQHGLVPLDDQLQVLRPAKLWNDTTSAEQAQRLVSLLGTEAWTREVGSVPTAAFTVSKLAWLAENEPQHFARMRHCLLPHDWLILELTGQIVTDRADASGTGYFDPVRNVWTSRVLELVSNEPDWRSMLPRICQPGEVAGTASTRQASELGLDNNAVVGPGTGDQAAAALGLGAFEGDGVVSLGTSGTVYGESVTPVIDTEGWINGTANAMGGFQPVVVSLNAAKVTDTFARILGVGRDEFSELALSAPVTTANRAALVGYLDGERSPNRPTARGRLVGLSSSTTRAEVALAAFESVAFGLWRGYLRLLQVGVSMEHRLILTGGAAHARGHQIMLANVFGRSVSMPSSPCPSDSARGAAVQAAAALRRAEIRTVATEWAPQTVEVAQVTPEYECIRDEMFERYQRAADITLLDGLWV